MAIQFQVIQKPTSSDTGTVVTPFFNLLSSLFFIKKEHQSVVLIIVYLQIEDIRGGQKAGTSIGQLDDRVISDKIFDHMRNVV